MWHEHPRSKTYGADAVNCPTEIEIGSLATVEENGVLSSEFKTSTQSYTHLDVPRHYFTDGDPLDEVSVDRFFGEAALFDMSHKDANEAVTAEDLENADVDLREGDIAIIRTDWTDEAWGTPRFWLEMIHLAEDAGKWLMDQGIKGLAQDFFTDVKPVEGVCEHCGKGWIVTEENKARPSHNRFLSNGVILFEWLTNLGEVQEERVEFVGLPLKILGADGSPMRAVVIER